MTVTSSCRPSPRRGPTNNPRLIFAGAGARNGSGSGGEGEGEGEGEVITRV